jgi:DNA primase
MRIPESTVEQVRQSADIVDVVSQYVQLKKKGKHHWGVCPFHSEKTPSFSVNAEKQIFHCFGCHTGGNVFKFLMEYKKLSYVEAILELAKEYSIPVKYERSGNSEQQSEKELMFDLNEEVGRIFLETLLKSPNAQRARDYFEKRNIKTQSIRSFGLGFAPPERSFLVDHFSGNPEKSELAIKLGLIIRSDSGRLYDRFAGRIIFPIFSPNGRVIAFAGRVMESGGDTAKYVNSPESAIYTKGKVLYGLSIAKDEIRRSDSAIMVEGYMDLLALYQHGIKNVIAVSGTALTEDQTILLSRYTKNVIAMFDADEAGIKASMRSVEILLRKNMNISIASLGNNEDPDSFINKYGKPALLERLDKAVDFLEFQTSFYASKGMLDDPQKSVETIRELLRPVALIEDELKRILLLKALAQKFFLREKLLEDELQVIIERNKASERSPAPAAKAAERNKSVPDEQVQAMATKFAPLEKELIKLLCEGEPEIILMIKAEISPEELMNESAKKILRTIYTAIENGEQISLSALVDRLEDEALERELTMIAFDSFIVSDRWEELTPSPDKTARLTWATTDTIRRIKLLLIDKEQQVLRAELEHAKDDAETLSLMTQLRESLNKKKNIEAKYIPKRQGF